jgi:hypothetical protein
MIERLLAAIWQLDNALSESSPLPSSDNPTYSLNYGFDFYISWAIILHSRKGQVGVDDLSLSAQQKVTILGETANAWKKAQTLQYVYENAIENVSKQGRMLAWGTVLLAVLTTISGAFDAAGLPLTLLTLFIGSLTALLASADKVLTPTERSLEYVARKEKILSVKRNLNLFCLGIDQEEDYNTALKKIAGHGEPLHSAEANLPRAPSKGEKKQAKADFDSGETSIAYELERCRKAAGEVVPAAVVPRRPLAEDAAGVIERSRPIG